MTNWFDTWSGNSMPNDGGREKQPGYRDISDAEFQAFMAEHESGANTYEIAAFLGLTPARVGQILRKALVKLRTECARRGISAHDFPVKETTWDRMAG